MSVYSNEVEEFNMSSEHENELIRKRQEHEIKILGDMEREIRNKLTFLEESIKRMRKKKMMKKSIHQRSVSNPEENTEMKNNCQFEPVKSKSSENIVNAVINRGVLRSSASYDNRRLNKIYVPIVPETRRVRAGTPDNYLAETQPQYNYSQNIEEPTRSTERIERPKTSNGIYSPYIPTVERNNYTRHPQPSHIVKTLSAGVATKKYRQYEKENYYPRVNPAITGAMYGKKKSLNDIMPRDQDRWQRNIDTNPGRSSSAFGMYRTNISVGGRSICDTNSLTRTRNEPIRTRARQVESKQRFPEYMQKEVRSYSTENLLEKRPLAKTNSTILNSNDFQIISLESRTVAQQIKLKELEKRYYNEDKILTKTEWATFVSKFSETQKEVRNLDNEWQELFNELISYNSEYNDHMNKIRMWVTALKADSKFLQDIMAQNLGTSM
ncbi:hypothetical protein LOD99_15320 [Oopsacas minuta]|uniref:Uncharacterized protein n=1 Tax=Oopsacas minuta TaxID=111878 RepID=A0AAV7KCC9_9METZ|nr:hypothetical protein LOD99_15320 [Oopsacas minuta]